MTENAVFLLSAIAAFVAFIIFAILVRIGRTESPFRALCKWHALFAIIYLSIAWVLTKRPLSSLIVTPEFWVGGYVYWALHYAFFSHFFGQIVRGFSMNICVLIYERGGRATAEEIAKSYGGGAGVEYVQRDRLQVMKESAAITESGGRLSLTRFGRFALFLNQILFRLWKIEYLGVESR